MFVLGLQGSPRKKGNTAFLLSALMEALEARGARTRTLEVAAANIEPCREYIVCEKKGFCPIKDEMESVYAWLWEADVVVAGSPVFFYHVTAQLKALIDRCQTLWARKYRLRLVDPGRPTRKGFLLSVAATRGRQLFDGVRLTAEYFFDAVGARFEGELVYRGIEHAGDMRRHPTVMEDVQQAADRLAAFFGNRKRVFFAGEANDCRSRMAGAFARFLAGDRLEALDAGARPAAQLHPAMVEAMHERGIDMGFRPPRHLDDALREVRPDIVVCFGNCRIEPAGFEVFHWDLPGTADAGAMRMNELRDEIERRVNDLIQHCDESIAGKQ